MTGLNEQPQSRREEGAILTRAESDAMETRVMSVGCTDADFRRLMDSHESLRNCVAYFTGRTQSADCSENHAQCRRAFAELQERVRDLTLERDRLREAHDALADVVEAIVPHSWRMGRLEDAPDGPWGDCAGGSCDGAPDAVVNEHGDAMGPYVCILHRLQQGQDYDVRETTT